MRTAFCIACGLIPALLSGGTCAQQRAPERRYEAIAIVQPQDQSTVFDNSGHVEVQIRVSPAGELVPGDRIVLFLDERPMPLQALENVDRGTHRLQARIVDRNDRIVIESNPVTFYRWQASRNFPSRR
jgi:hypothetical protein